MFGIETLKKRIESLEHAVLCLRGYHKWKYDSSFGIKVQQRCEWCNELGAEYVKEPHP